MRRRAVDRPREYLLAWDDFRRNAEPVGWRAWLFRGREGVWLEFVEGKAQDRAAMQAQGTPGTAAAEDQVARWGEVMEESWWDEVPPGGEPAADEATGG